MPISIGDHIRKKRLQLGLLQSEVAERLGVSACTVLNWEKGHTEPPLSAMPAIFQFLGYDPFREPTTLPEHLLSKRREMGWTIKEAARVAGIDSGTWRDWERGKLILYRRYRAQIAKMLGLSFDAFDQEMTARWNQLHKSDP